MKETIEQSLLSKLSGNDVDINSIFGIRVDFETAVICLEDGFRASVGINFSFEDNDENILEIEPIHLKMNSLFDEIGKADETFCREIAEVLKVGIKKENDSKPVLEMSFEEFSGFFEECVGELRKGLILNNIK